MMSLPMRQWIRTYATLGSLLLVCVVFAFLSPQAFATVDNAINVTRQIAFLVLIAVGATFVMAAGEFDLSVGAMASFAGVMAAQLAVNGTDVVVSVALTLGMCVLMGMFNGWLVGYFGVLSFITTLATGTMLSGLTFWLTGGSTVFENIPDNFSWLGRAVFAGLPGPSLVMLGVVLMAWVVMHQTVFGRQLYAVGGNNRAARLAGVSVLWHKVGAFGLCALAAAIAGVLLASRLGSAHPTGGNGLFLPAYAAAFLGTTAVRGGMPNVLGSLLGAATLGILANGLTILNVPSFLQDMLTGAIVVAAIVSQKWGDANSR
jgi:ribose transport system permease protein